MSADLTGVDDEYQAGPACPDCGFAVTTVYPMDDEGSTTLYCDNCKREEPYQADED